MPKGAGGTRPKGISKDLLKKIKNLLDREMKMPDFERSGRMSPGKIKAITGKNPGEMKKRRIKLGGMSPMVGSKGGTGGLAKKAALAAGKGSGKTLSKAGMKGMNKALFTEAKKLKPSGRLSVDDLKRTREMLKKRKGKQHGNDS